MNMEKKQFKVSCFIRRPINKILRTVFCHLLICFCLFFSPVSLSAAEVVAVISNVEDLGNKTYRLVIDKGIKNGVQLNAEGKIYILNKSGKRMYSPGTGTVDRSLDNSSDIRAIIQSFPPKPDKDIIVFQVSNGMDSTEQKIVEIEDNTVGVPTAVDLGPSQSTLVETAKSDKGMEGAVDDFTTVSLDPSPSTIEDAGKLDDDSPGIEEPAQSDKKLKEDVVDDQQGPQIGGFNAALQARNQQRKEKEKQKKKERAEEKRVALLADIQSYADNKEWSKLEDSIGEMEGYPDLTKEQEDFLQKMSSRLDNYRNLSVLLKGVKANLDTGNMNGLEGDLKQAKQMAQNLKDDFFLNQVRKYRSLLQKRQKNAQYEKDCQKQAKQLQKIIDNFSEAKAIKALKVYSSCSSSKSYETQNVRMIKKAVEQSKLVSRELEQIENKCRKNDFSISGNESQVKNAISFFSTSGFKSYGKKFAKELAKIKELCEENERILVEERQRKQKSFDDEFRSLHEDVVENIASSNKGQVGRYFNELDGLLDDDLYETCGDCSSMRFDIEEKLDRRKEKLTKRNKATNYIP